MTWIMDDLYISACSLHEYQQVCYSDLFCSQVLSQASFKRWPKAVDVWINIFQVFIFKKKLKKNHFHANITWTIYEVKKFTRIFATLQLTLTSSRGGLGVERSLHKKCNSAPVDRTLAVPLSEIPSEIKTIVAFNEISELDFTHACFLISKFFTNHINHLQII